MARLALVHALEDDWQETLDGIARSRSWPTSREVARLAARVVDLSAAYNDPTRARAAMAAAGAARLGFSFARDVPKAAAAARELIATGALRLDGTLRVLDLGAGLGATTWGLTRALAAAGARGAIDAVWVDPDAEALDLATELLRARGGREGAVQITARRRAGSLGTAGTLGRFDVVLVGQVLSELDRAVGDEERVRLHADLLRSLIDECLEPEGSLVVVEPALRERTRHLHRVRDALVAPSATFAVTVFAPCLHSAPCPALARDSDWCHEDLEVDVPAWLVPVARAAGLRHEGLTFSYLVLRRAHGGLSDAVRGPEGAARLRVVSDEIRSKGKREAFVCGELQGPSGPVATRARLTRLDRDARPSNAAWERLRRGDIAVVAPAPDVARPRVGAASTVELSLLRAIRSGEGESR